MGIFLPPAHKVDKKGVASMKRVVVVSLLLLAVNFLLPIFMLSRPEKALPSAPDLLLPEQEPLGADRLARVQVLMEDGTVQTMTRADYLWGVTAAEMPASFHPEALKAQSVAARTYFASLPADKHPGADVCADSGCCQAYISRDQARANWGERAEELAGRISQAVEGTDGLVATYEGRPIQALFFSSAPGSTVDARAVWGTHVPYLVSVASPEGDGVPNYRSQLTLSADELRAMVLAQYPQADLSGPCEDWLRDMEREPSGTVSRLTVGGVELTGGQLRKLLDLRSACFTVSVKGGEVTFHVTGYGHGVGMSQYGANELAGQGKDFRQILQWYYTGVEVERMDIA